jgi:hypothetical protein
VIGAVAFKHSGGEKLAFNQVHSAHGFGGHRGDALEHTECTSVTHIIYGMESCTNYIGKLHESCRFWWYELHVHRRVYSEQEVCEARTSEKTQVGREGPGGPWNIRNNIYRIPYTGIGQP